MQLKTTRILKLLINKYSLFKHIRRTKIKKAF